MNHKTLILLTTLISASALNGMEKKDLSLRERFCVWTTRHPWTTLCASTLVGMGAGYAFRNSGACKHCSVAANIAGGGSCGALTGVFIVGWNGENGKQLILNVVNPQEQCELAIAEHAFLASNDHDCATGFADWQRLKEAEYRHAVELKSYRNMPLRERLGAAYYLRKHPGYQNDAGHDRKHLERIIAVFEQQLRTKEQLAAERKFLNF